MSLGPSLDDLDKRIISELCISSQGSYRQIAKRLGIHPTTLIQRVKNLEKLGIIHGYRANVDYLKLGYEFMAIVHISVEGDLLDVEQKVKDLKDVVAVFDVTGECDLHRLGGMQESRGVQRGHQVHADDKRRQEDKHLRRAEHDKGPIPVPARVQ